jgi:hypothetical protein
MISDQASFPPTQNHALINPQSPNFNQWFGVRAGSTAVLSLTRFGNLALCLAFQFMSLLHCICSSQENPGEDQESTYIHEQKDAY